MNIAIFSFLAIENNNLNIHCDPLIKTQFVRWKPVDLGFHFALSYRDLKHPTSRQNFANVVGQNHALILTQCRMLHAMNSRKNQFCARFDLLPALLLGIERACA